MASKLCMIATTAHIIFKNDLEQAYYTKPEKFILICNDSMIGANLKVLGKFGFHCSDKKRYVGSFIGMQEQHPEWMAPKFATLVEGVKKLASVEHRYPQTAYTGLTKSMQSR